jgi:hypothetical protein
MEFYFILSNLKNKNTMKTIEPVSIWDNGAVQEAKILNAYAVNVTLGTSATFYYQLFAETVDLAVGPQLAQGNLIMTGDAYTQWEVDSYAWDWIAQQLNLTITGDYNPSVPTTTSTTTTESPTTSTTTTAVVAE